MLELTFDRKVAAYTRMAQKLVRTDDPVLVSHGISVLIYAQELLTEARKANSVDHRNLIELSGILEGLVQSLKPPEDTIRSQDKKPPVPTEALTHLRHRTRRVAQEEDGSKKNAAGQIETEMLLMTHEMRHAANLMHSTIRKDIQVLSTTTDLQDMNFSDTQNQNLNAKSIRSAKRLGLLWTIFMMIVSLFIFGALVPLILVTYFERLVNSYQKIFMQL